jgi:exodeoxyribonuclease VII small subunit
MAKKELSYEEAMQQLEEIVRRLEKGDVPLEESLALFEKGSGLIARCSKLLDEAEQKVVRLKKGSDGSPEELPFESED